MPIPSEELDTRFILAAPDDTIGALLARLPSDRAERAFTFVVLPVAGGRYIVVRWAEVEQIVMQIEGSSFDQSSRSAV